MPAQNYANHRHNPRLSSIGLLLLLMAVSGFALRVFGIGGDLATALWFFGLVGAMLVLLTLNRVSTTRLQDRIIKLEMNMRCAGLLTPAQLAILAGLTRRQVIALRFASDAEMPALVERASLEKLSPDQIKRAIKDWTADWDRA